MTTRIPVIDSLWSSDETWSRRTNEFTTDSFVKVINQDLFKKRVLVQNTKTKEIRYVSLEDFNRDYVHLKPCYVELSIRTPDADNSDERINQFLDAVTMSNEHPLFVYDWTLEEEHVGGFIVILVAFSSVPILDQVGTINDTYYRVIQ
jgi:hypothetical protein